MRETTDISLADYRKLTAGRKRTKRPGIPRAAQAKRTGLATRLLEGWSVQSPDSERYRLYLAGQPDYDTGLCCDLSTACDAAGALWKAAGMTRKKALKG